MIVRLNKNKDKIAPWVTPLWSLHLLEMVPFWISLTLLFCRKFARIFLSFVGRLVLMVLSINMCLRTDSKTLVVSIAAITIGYGDVLD